MSTGTTDPSVTYDPVRQLFYNRPMAGLTGQDTGLSMSENGAISELPARTCCSAKRRRCNERLAGPVSGRKSSKGIRFRSTTSMMRTRSTTSMMRK